MTYESTYPAPVYGVSTLSPRDRKYGMAEVQVNFRSDPVSKLTRRPPVKWKKKLATIAEDVVSHEYTRNGANVRVLVTNTGNVKAYINDIEKPVVGDISSYLGNVTDVVMKTINDTTIILNKSKTVRMSSGTDTMIERVAHINVTSALNYGEKLRIKTQVGVSPPIYYEYAIPDLGATPNYDDADKARATSAVAKALADQINADLFGFATAKHKGSTIALWYKLDPFIWLEVEVESGQGDKSVIAVNQTIEDVAGLPRYAVHGTHIKVQPNPETTKGIYYLTARATRLGATIPLDMNLRELEEVVWAESRSNVEPYHLDETTMPRALVYNALTDSFTVGYPTGGWADRKTGDNNSCKVPVFVNKTIEHLGYFQKRLVFVSDNSVIMSKTDDIFNFWRQSAVSLLVTDPVSIDASTTDIDKLNFITNHNKDLLIVTRNAQLKIAGDVPVTPETIAMPVVTEFDISVTAEPTSLGNSMMLPLSYGASSGLTRYERERDREQDNANDITSHAVGYILGDIKKMTSSSNLEMVLVQNGTELDTLYVYEQFTYSDENLQNSWSKWVFPFTIVSFKFVNNVLSILYREPSAPSDLHVATMQFHTQTGEQDKIYLDKSISLYLPDGVTAPVPDGFNHTDCIAVSVGQNLKYLKIPFTVSDGILTLSRNLGLGARVIVGKETTAIYRPTRPFKRDKEGIVVTSDKLRLTRFTLHLNNTGSVSMRVVSKHYDPDVQQFIEEEVQRFYPRELGAETSILGQRSIYTGDANFAFPYDADIATAEFYTNDYLGLTISGISWLGQFFQRRRRM